MSERWAERDAATASSWASGLPRDAVRDAALSGLFEALDTVPAAATLALFSSDSARQDAVLRVVARFPESDPSGARGLIDDYLTHPDRRRQAQLFVSE